MCDHHQLVRSHSEISLIVSPLVTIICPKSKQIASNACIMRKSILLETSSDRWGRRRVDLSCLMQGLLVIVHDGSYMPHLANIVCACAAVIYCSHTNQYVDINWVEKSTKKIANNCRAKILEGGST
jgi:hypothetical protein